MGKLFQKLWYKNKLNLVLEKTFSRFLLEKSRTHILLVIAIVCKMTYEIIEIILKVECIKIKSKVSNNAS